MDLLTFAGWQLLVIASLFGWGELLRVILRLDKPRNYLGINLLLGCAAATGVGGLGTAVGVAGPAFWVLLVVTGVLPLLWLRHTAIHMLNSARRDFRTFVSNIAIFGIASSVALGNLLERPLSPYDDEPAYFYLSKRLWSLGEIHDTFNSRRLQSHGATTFLQTIGMGPLPDKAFNSFDEIVGATLLLSLVFIVHGTYRRPWTAALLIVVISFHSERGAGTSMTSLFFTAVYAVTAHEVLANWHAARDRRGQLVQIQIVVIALLTLMRPFAGAVLAMFLIWQIFPGRILRTTWLTWRLSGSVIAIVTPWMLLQYRDSGTPAFPLLAGVSSRVFPLAGDRSSVRIGPYLVDSAVELVLSGAIPWLAACFVLALFVTGLPARAGLMRSSQMSYFALLAAIPTYTLALALTFPHWGTPLHWTRYWSPIVIGSGLVAIVMASEKRWGRVHTRLIAVPLQALLVFGGFTALPHTTALAVTSDLTRVINGEFAHDISSDLFADDRSNYDDVRQAIPPGSVVLSATQLPHLLLGDDFTVLTADFPGAAVPNGEFPWGETYIAKVQWLMEQDVDFLLVHSRESDSIFYAYEERVEWLKVDHANRVIAMFMLEWLDFTYELIDSTEPVVISGDLVLISVERLR